MRQSTALRRATRALCAAALMASVALHGVNLVAPSYAARVRAPRAQAAAALEPEQAQEQHPGEQHKASTSASTAAVSASSSTNVPGPSSASPSASESQPQHAPAYDDWLTNSYLARANDRIPITSGDFTSQFLELAKAEEKLAEKSGELLPANGFAALRGRAYGPLRDSMHGMRYDFVGNMFPAAGGSSSTAAAANSPSTGGGEAGSSSPPTEAATVQAATASQGSASEQQQHTDASATINRLQDRASSAFDGFVGWDTVARWRQR